MSDSYNPTFFWPGECAAVLSRGNPLGGGESLRRPRAARPHACVFVPRVCLSSASFAHAAFDACCCCRAHARSFAPRIIATPARRSLLVVLGVGRPWWWCVEPQLQFSVTVDVALVRAPPPVTDGRLPSSPPAPPRHDHHDMTTRDFFSLHDVANRSRPPLLLPGARRRRGAIPLRRVRRVRVRRRGRSRAARRRHVRR